MSRVMVFEAQPRRGFPGLSTEQLERAIGTGLSLRVWRGFGVRGDSGAGAAEA